MNDIWVTVNECSDLLGITDRAVRKSIEKYKFRIVQGNGGRRYEIALSSLPQAAQTKYIKNLMDTIDNSSKEASVVHIAHNIDDGMHAYNTAPSYARAFADKWSLILQETENMRRKEIDAYVVCKRQIDPTIKVSRTRIYEMRKRYAAGGIAGLLPSWGKNAGSTIAPDEAYDIFKVAYLKEGAPSLETCYIQAWGEYKLNNPDSEFSSFPSKITFLRRIKKEIPEEALYKARYGESKWKRKYQSFIERDFSNINSGEIWVSDHAQIDVAVRLDDSSIHFPWLTVWRDFKSGLFLGWMIEIGAGNSDRIFQTFYYAASTYGLPKAVIIDNGKDYRSKDFAGGRKSIKIGTDESIATSMLSKLGVKPHFAIPYNSQTKNIERDFRTIKEYFSKNLIGYRGGNILERPEILQKEIKTHQIMHFDNFRIIFEQFIEQVLHVMPCGGKLKGKSRLEAFNNDFKDKRVISQDALMLFCMRVSDVVTIRRNGLYDNKLDQWYWGEWMAGSKGTKVYMRRDPKSYQDAYIFNAADDRFLGKARMGALTAPAFAETEIEKAKLMDATRLKKLAQKQINVNIRRAKSDPLEVLTRMVVGINHMAETNISEASPILQMTQTDMDKVIEQANKRQNTDIASIMPPENHKSKKIKKIKLFEVEY